jgi:predicted nucleic acid-binding protein
VRFWDTSALVPQFVAERQSERVGQWLRDDSEVAVWMLTRVELVSAIVRRQRERPELAPFFRHSLQLMIDSSAMWIEVNDAAAVRRHAEAILQHHPLRAADALQLGAALEAAEGDPSALEFVTLDRSSEQRPRARGSSSWVGKVLQLELLGARAMPTAVSSRLARGRKSRPIAPLQNMKVKCAARL